jgi:hypothetical protein
MEEQWDFSNPAPPHREIGRCHKVQVATGDHKMGRGQEEKE